MYALVDALCTLTGIAGIVVCCVKKQEVFLPLPIGWLIFYPFFNETIYNLVSGLKKVVYDPIPKRIVYHPSYNISFCGIEKMHPFDSQKYGNVFNRLLAMGVINEKDDVIKP